MHQPNMPFEVHDGPSVPGAADSIISQPLLSPDNVLNASAEAIDDAMIQEFPSLSMQKQTSSGGKQRKASLMQSGGARDGARGSILRKGSFAIKSPVSKHRSFQ
jgi:hypothetical protein